MLTTTFITIGFVVLTLPGIIFAVLGLPGASYIFIVSLLYAFTDRFQHLSGTELAILGGIAVISIITDQLAGIIGSRWGGARGTSFLYGIIGLIIGNVIFPIIGGMIGLFLGITTGEIVRRTKNKSDEALYHSVKAGLGGIIGAVTGIVIHSVIALVMIGLYVFFVV